jgi:hypothetical protein
VYNHDVCPLILREDIHASSDSQPKQQGFWDFEGKNKQLHAIDCHCDSKKALSEAKPGREPLRVKIGRLVRFVDDIEKLKEINTNTAHGNFTILGRRNPRGDHHEFYLVTEVLQKLIIVRNMILICQGFPAGRFLTNVRRPYNTALRYNLLACDTKMV